MDRLDNHCLITIFKHLDFQSRFQASMTCRLWHTLMQDSETLLDDISEIRISRLTTGNDNEPYLANISSHIGYCHRVTLIYETYRSLPEEAIQEYLHRFGNIRLEWNGNDDNELSRASLMQLPSAIKNLSFSARFNDNAYSPLDFRRFFDLEQLEVEMHCTSDLQPTIRVPPSLRSISIHGYYIHFPNPVFDNGFYIHFQHPAVRISIRQCLTTIESCPLLEELCISGIHLDQRSFIRLFGIFRSLPNLRRVHFRNIDFDQLSRRNLQKHSTSDLTFQWIKFEDCKNHWSKVAELLIKASEVKTVVISLKDKIDQEEIQNIYTLGPLIEAKNANLELNINRLDDFEASFDLSRILTKLELGSVHLLRSICVDQLEKSTEIKLHNCIGLGTTELAVIAEGCLNLEKLSIKPCESFGQDVITDQCLQPFFRFWINRESKQLSIECLRTDLAFGWFQGRLDEEYGWLEDGKRWMRFRNSALAGKKKDGSIHAGTRIEIWDQNGKRLVIRDYEKNFGEKLQISEEDTGFRVEQV